MLNAVWSRQHGQFRRDLDKFSHSLSSTYMGQRPSGLDTSCPSGRHDGQSTRVSVGSQSSSTTLHEELAPPYPSMDSPAGQSNEWNGKPTHSLQSSILKKFSRLWRATSLDERHRNYSQHITKFFRLWRCETRYVRLRNARLDDPQNATLL